MPIDGHNVGNHNGLLVVERSINLRPPIRTLFLTWSVGKVNEMLSLWGPARKLDLRTLIYKI